MTTHITNRKGNKLQLNGDLLTGDTYPMKDFIKTYMDGKWVSEQKAWRVNVSKVNRLIEQKVIRIDDDIDNESKPAKSLMSYEHFLRSADDPNSDY